MSKGQLKKLSKLQQQQEKKYADYLKTLNGSSSGDGSNGVTENLS